MNKNQKQLWLPPSVQQHRKADPPETGPIGRWSEDGIVMATMPGGGILQFDLSRLTMSDYRMMRDHYQINANLTLLTFMIHQIDWHIECEDKKIAEEIEGQLRIIWTQLVRGISQAFWAGYSPMILEYENDVQNRRVVLDKVKDLIPEDARVNWKTVDGYAPQDKPKPKVKIYDGIKQVGLHYPIPVDNTLWYPLLMENGDHYGKKLLRSAFVPWFFSMLIHMYANRYFERFGEPLPIGRADYEADVQMGDEVVTGRQAMERILYALRSRSVVTLPSDRDQDGNYDFDLEYLESQMRGADFERYLTRLDEEMSLGLFTPILMLRTADVGSYNLGVNHMQVWMWMLNAIAGDIKQYIDDYVVERLKAFNFTPNAPRCEWVPRKMGKQSEETMRAIITEMLRGGKVAPADLVEMGQAIGLTLKQVRQVTQQEADPDPDEPREDDRTGAGRPERASGGNGGPSVENARATSREISERVEAQVAKAMREGKFSQENWKPNIGFRRRFENSLVQGGFSEDRALGMADSFFEAIDEWLEDFLATDYSSAEEFMSDFNRMLEYQVGRL